MLSIVPNADYCTQPLQKRPCFVPPIIHPRCSLNEGRYNMLYKLPLQLDVDAVLGEALSTLRPTSGTM